MIEELEGGTITTRHRYSVGACRRRFGVTSLHEGVQEPFDRPVWIHVYDLGEDQEALEVELIEGAHDLASLDHPALLTALDHGQLDVGVPFVITERSPHPTLAELLARAGTLSPAETAALLGALAPALDALHAVGLAHGALSAHAVYVDPDDLPGARLGHTASGLTLDALTRVDAPLDRDSLLPLPPEMCRGDAHAHTEAGDVYALGALAYQCLTGDHPFFPDGEDPDAGLLQIKTRHARPLDELGFDAPLSDLVDAALDPDPDSRPASARSLARELGVLTHEHAPEPSTPSPRDTDPRPSPREDHDDPSLDLDGNPPDARGAVAALALLALIASNVAWLLFTAPFAEDTSAAPEPTPPPSLSILPQGLQLDSAPPGALIHVVRPEGEDLLGEAPQVINPALPRNESMRLRISSDGYRPVLLDVAKRSDGQDVTLQLEKLD
jgi:serine/threonine protein kinase